MKDAEFEQFVEKLRSHYAQIGKGNEAYQRIGDVAVAFERWFWLMSSEETGPVTNQQMLDAVVSLTVTFLARVVDPAFDNMSDEGRAFMIDNLFEAMANALLVPPHERQGREGFALITSEKVH